MIDTVIFDLDGTLLNTLEDLHASVNFAMNAHGFKERTLDEVRHFVGNGVDNLIARCIPSGKENPKYEEALATFKKHYIVHCNDKTGPYPGISDMLSKLKREGYKMAVVSNKFMDATKELVALYFGDLVEVAIGASDTLRKKPAPDTVEEALRQLASDKDRSVYVGDSEVDVATAKNSGMECIAVAWGFREKKEQVEAGARIFAESPEEVPDIVRNMKGPAFLD